MKNEHIVLIKSYLDDYGNMSLILIINFLNNYKCIINSFQRGLY